MDRRRIVGIVPVVVSAAAFGSGPLCAKPAYALGLGWLPLLAWRFTIAAGAGFWLIALVSATPVAPGQLPSAAWPNIVAVAVISTFVSIQAFAAGSRRIGAAQASLISTVEPVWTICLAALLLGERLGPVQLAGGVLVIGGVLLAQLQGGDAATVPGAPGTVRIADE